MRTVTAANGCGATRAALLATAIVVLAVPVAGRDQSYGLRIDLTADIRNLGADDLFVSEPAADHLVGLGPAVVPVLATALRREPPATRVGIVGVLQQIEGDGATRLLIEATDDPEAQVRADALLALGLRKDLAGGAAVERHLDDPQARVRRSAALACNSVCRSPAALARLVTIALRDSEATAAQQSLRSIVTSGGPATAAAARAAIEAQALPLLAATDGDPSLRINAALVAALAGRREAVPVLAAAAAQPQPVLRMNAVLALGTVPEPDAVAALAPLARGDDDSLRKAACISLSQLRDDGVAGAAQAGAACQPTPPPRQEPR
jgi:HEAT repeat protein